MGTTAVRSMAIMLGLLLFMAAAVMVVNGSVALATEYQGPGGAPPSLIEEGPGDCDVGVVFYEPPDCDCPEGTEWILTYEPGHEGDEEYITSGICGTATSLTGDTVPSLTTDVATETTSVSGSAYSTSLPSTGLPLAVLFASGLAAAGAGLVFAGRRGRR